MGAHLIVEASLHDREAFMKRAAQYYGVIRRYSLTARWAIRKTESDFAAGYLAVTVRPWSGLGLRGSIRRFEGGCTIVTSSEFHSFPSALPA
jgi:hypothetical protein